MLTSYDDASIGQKVSFTRLSPQVTSSYLYNTDNILAVLASYMKTSFEKKHASSADAGLGNNLISQSDKTIDKHQWRKYAFGRHKQERYILCLRVAVASIEDPVEGNASLTEQASKASRTAESEEY